MVQMGARQEIAVWPTAEELELGGNDHDLTPSPAPGGDSDLFIGGAAADAGSSQKATTGKGGGYPPSGDDQSRTQRLNMPSWLRPETVKGTETPQPGPAILGYPAVSFSSTSS